MVKEFYSIQEMVDEAQERKIKLSDLILEYQAQAMGKSQEDLLQIMDDYFQVMIDGTHFHEEDNLPSTSGLTGGESEKIMAYARSHDGGFAGSFFTKALARGVSVSNCNAAMGQIVATPTAGSCGILPGCLVTMLEDDGVDRDKLVRALFVAAGFGIVIARTASIAGAEGGCQAECGSASGMAAAAMVEVLGGTPAQSADACGMALINQLGLVCDPVAGLVEIPCVKRNAGSIAIALSAATMAMAGVDLYIPVDEVIAAMKKIGDTLPASLKETAGGGLAQTETGRALRDKVFGKIKHEEAEESLD